jgi:hypothetical protein
MVYWSFNNKSLVADIGGRQGKLLYIGNTNMGYAQGNSTSLQDWGWLITTFPTQSQPFSSGTAGIEIHMDTRGYESIILCFDQWADSDASRWVQMDYSPDGGICWFIADWRNKGMLTPHGKYHTFSIDFSDIPEANDNPNFRVRLTSSYSPVAFYENAYVEYDGQRAYMRSNENTVYQTENRPAHEYGSYNPNASWRFDNIIIKGIPLGPLPVRFSDFTAVAKKGFNEISFTTSAEVNNDFFEVERSHDGTRFEAISQIKGKGNSSEENKYTCQDFEYKSSLNYYRIKQVDFDGTSSHTDIKVVINDDPVLAHIYPTVTDGLIHIYSPEENYNIDIFDTTGNKIKSQNGFYKSHSLDISDLRPGNYHIQIYTPHSNQTFKVVKM